jgi:hypothetical protein
MTAMPIVAQTPNIYGEASWVPSGDTTFLRKGLLIEAHDGVRYRVRLDGTSHGTVTSVTRASCRLLYGPMRYPPEAREILLLARDQREIEERVERCLRRLETDAWLRNR